MENDLYQEDCNMFVAGLTVLSVSSVLLSHLHPGFDSRQRSHDTKLAQECVILNCDAQAIAQSNHTVGQIQIRDRHIDTFTRQLLQGFLSIPGNSGCKINDFQSSDQHITNSSGIINSHDSSLDFQLPRDNSESTNFLRI
jgi:hypothetical protein